MRRAVPLLALTAGVGLVSAGARRPLRVGAAWVVWPLLARVALPLPLPLRVAAQPLPAPVPVRRVGWRPLAAARIGRAAPAVAGVRRVAARSAATMASSPRITQAPFASLAKIAISVPFRGVRRYCEQRGTSVAGVQSSSLTCGFAEISRRFGRQGAVVAAGSGWPGRGTRTPVGPAWGPWGRPGGRGAGLGAVGPAWGPWGRPGGRGAGLGAVGPAWGPWGRP